VLFDLVRLIRWLGPWADGKVPVGVTRWTVAPPGLARAYMYAPQARDPAGAYLVAPGLHHLGPDDPRMDRFCRVLAASGLLVMAPFVEDYLRLRIAPAATDDLAAAFDEIERAARREGLARPAVFSISFGSLPTLALAARPSHRDRVGALVVFGGFADFEASVRFAITGTAERNGARLSLARDPLNSPAVFLNLLGHLEVAGDPALLARAWRTMVERTWGRMELKAPGARDPIAHAIAEDLPAELRELFLMGCGLRPGAAELLAEVLAAAGEHFRFFDPRPHLRQIEAPVVLLHGRDDDVIPWFESEKLRDGLKPGHPHRLIVTGLAAHTSVALPKPAEVAREIGSGLACAHAICAAARGRLSGSSPRAPW
jgi:pimeloyl-ACP methyl ester carboxylesterase